MNNESAPLLFLDFDGVLHPAGATPDALFSRMPLLAQGLRERLASAQVVISSDWRHYHAFDDLRAHFPADLRHRVVGCTADDTVVTVRTWGALAERHPRQAQVMAWLARHRGSLSVPWVALDDRPQWFLPAEPRLVVVPAHTGLQDEHLNRAADLLNTG